MPVANISGVDIHYEILGERGPFVALQPGGRRAGSGVRSLAEKVAEAGYRVIAYDRRNTGASGVAIEGEAENDEWAEDLHELLGRLDGPHHRRGAGHLGRRNAGDGRLTRLAPSRPPGAERVGLG